MPSAPARAAVLLALAANLIAVVLRLPASGTHAAQTHLYPIALFSRGIYTDAVSDVSRPNHRLSPLTSIRHFALVTRGRKVGEFNVQTLEVSPARLPPFNTCSRIIIGTVGPPNPHAGALWFRGSSGLAVSAYNPTVDSGGTPNAGRTLKRYQRDVLAAARMAITTSQQFSISSLVVMDVGHNGKVELWAKVIGDNRYAIIWLGYPNGKSRTLRAETFELAGGSGSLPEFVDTADIEGDGVDEVVIRDQHDTADSYEIDKLTQSTVRRVFQGPIYGC